MKKCLLVSSLAAALATPLGSPAQTPAPAAPTSPHTFTGNATLISDYRFRGISQTFRRPAFQGGFDYSHASGFYLGNWNSNVSGLVYPNGAGLEMDFYGGFKKTFGDFGFDAGYLYYYYPGARNVSAVGNTKFDNQEVYGALTYKWITAKASYAVSNYFGLNGVLARSGYFAEKDTGTPLTDRGSSRGTIYYDLTAVYEIVPKLTLGAHVGYTDVRNYNELDYFDYKLGATYDWNGWLLSAAVVGTNADKKWYYTRDSGGKTKETGVVALLVSIGRTF